LAFPAELRAYSVHLFTAAGAALALTALFAGVQHRWELMFFCLGGALLIDGIDGTLARRFKVTEVLPRWSGDVLDLVVDFVTYVFVPAYAIAASGLLPEGLGLTAGIVIVVTGALYFADRQMKMRDNYFRGFPALWNAAAFYLFLFRLNSWLAAAVIAILAVFTFVPFKFVHPFRVARLRSLTGLMVIVWSALAALALMRDFAPGPWITGGLVLAAVYFAGIGLTDRSQS
jgi:phosphatidylcholine synthase